VSALLVRRLLLSVPLVLVVTAISFVLVELLPGTAAAAILGTKATPEQIAVLDRELGLDLPVWQQYGRWLGGVLHGDLGTSTLTGAPVSADLAARLGVTLSLVVGAMLLTLVAGVALGVLTAVRRGVLSRCIDLLAVLGLAVPSFWLALILILLFSVRLGLLPSVGYVDPATSVGGWLQSLVLPVAALALGMVTTVAKQTRDSMLEVLERPFIASLRANGTSEARLIYRHALRNAAIPVVTVVGILFVNALTGAVFVEQIFVLPGLGSAVVSATAQRDIPTVQGTALFLTLLVVAINVAVDVTYGVLDPKVRGSR
jgi:peptide/nickel transport system permease protein